MRLFLLSWYRRFYYFIAYQRIWYILIPKILNPTGHGNIIGMKMIIHVHITIWIRKDDENRIQAAEMWFYRRLLRVKWTDKRTNESVLKELGVQCLMLSEISKRRLKYLAHVNRNTKTDLMTTVLQVKVEAKRNQGRPPTSYIDNVKADSGLQLYEVIHQSRDRNRWRPVVARSGAPTDGHGHCDRWLN